MSTSLSSSDVALLAAALTKRRSQVRNDVHSQLHQHGLETHVDAALPNRREDTDDDGAADIAAQMDIAAVTRVADELAELDQALQRLADGEYGDCIECGESISRDRLYINPAAIRCAECQQFAERSARVARLTQRAAS